jgi:hypothetical protein
LTLLLFLLRHSDLLIMVFRMPVYTPYASMQDTMGILIRLEGHG